MPRAAPFEAHHQRYEAWFEKHEAAYISELLALRPFVPFEGEGLELGVGSGRFAGPLGVAFGIDPAAEMLAYARARGVNAVRAVAEALPFANAAFDYALIVTTICFVDDPAAMLREAARVLKPGGALVIGFIDRDSPLGQHYLAHQGESVFYREATFVSASEVETTLEKTGFHDPVWAQTLSRPLNDIHDIEPVSPGRDRGAFLVVRARAGQAGCENRSQADYALSVQP